MLSRNAYSSRLNKINEDKKQQTIEKVFNEYPPATSWWLLKYSKVQRKGELMEAGAGRNVFMKDMGCHLNPEEPGRFAKVEERVSALST